MDNHILNDLNLDTYTIEDLPHDGIEALLTGDVVTWADYLQSQSDITDQTEKQGDAWNIAGVINHFKGLNTITQETVNGFTTDNSHLNADSVTIEQICEILKRYELEVQIVHEPTLTTLSENIASGQCILLEVDRAVLTGEASWALEQSQTINLIGIAYDNNTGTIIGGTYIDPVDGKIHYADAAQLTDAAKNAIIVNDRDERTAPAPHHLRFLGNCIGWSPYY